LTALQRGDGRPLRMKNVRNHISPRLRDKLTPIAGYVPTRAGLFRGPGHTDQPFGTDAPASQSDL